MSDNPDNPFKQIFTHYAERLHDAPGAARLARLAKTAKQIPEPLLADLTALILQLDDTELVGNDVALTLTEIAFCDTRISDATDFASELRARLRRYHRDRRVADAARGELRARVTWWTMAIGRMRELSKWPAIVLAEITDQAADLNGGF